MKPRQPALGKVPNPAVVYRKMRVYNQNRTLRRHGGAFFILQEKKGI